MLTDGNPNIIDSLFVPRHCVVYSTTLGEMVREKRHLFLNKGCWPTFKGYAYAQMQKMRNKVPEGKRTKLVEEFGYDVKFAYHVVRLLNEIEQIMAEATLDLDRNSEQLKAIRRGDWSEQQVETYFFEKEKNLERLFIESKLPIAADKMQIKALLLNCLEQHYGSLDKCIESTDRQSQALRDIQAILDSLK